MDNALEFSDEEIALIYTSLDKNHMINTVRLKESLSSKERNKILEMNSALNRLKKKLKIWVDDSDIDLNDYL